MKHWKFGSLSLAISLIGLSGCSSADNVAVRSQESMSTLQEFADTDAASSVSEAFTGAWALDVGRSTAIDPWRNLALDIEVDQSEVTLLRRWMGSREGGTFTDSSRFVIGGITSHTYLEQWPDNRHLGAYVAGDGTKSIAGWAEDAGTTLATEANLIVSVQQGERAIRIYSEYRLSTSGNRIDLIELRSTRPTPVHYVFRREAN